MKIECTVNELKELLSNIKETSVAGTTDVKIEPLTLTHVTFIEEIAKNLANYGTHEG